MKVYRVENAQGAGPYWLDTEDKRSLTQERVTDVIKWRHNDSTHASIWDDYELTSALTEAGASEDCSRYSCGFESISRAHEWFEGWFARLTRARFWLVEYDVPAGDGCLVGSSQVLFDKALATRTGRWRIENAKVSA